MKLSKVDDQLASDLIAALFQKGFHARAIEKSECKKIPEFNWDVRSYKGAAAISLNFEALDILHIVTVKEKGKLLYRAKILVPCPSSILDGLPGEEDPFSVSFRADIGEQWKDDIGIELGQDISQALNKEHDLTSSLLSSGHENVNAWLDVDSRLSINTAKRYTKLEEISDFLDVSNKIVGCIQSARF